MCYGLVSSIRTPVLIQGIHKGTETNLMHFKWEVTLTREKQSNTFLMGQRVNSHFVKNNDTKVLQESRSVELYWLDLEQGS